MFVDLVDRIARRPSGMLGYLFYRFPIGHKPGFDMVLKRLPPDSSDRIAEIGCGGGVFLRRAMASGCRAIAIDHSADMVANTASLNRKALDRGRLEVFAGDAAALPIADGSCDKAYCLNAFFFFPDPQASLCEMARILRPGGQLALITSPPEFEREIARFSKRMADSMRFDTIETLKTWCEATGLCVETAERVPSAGNLIIARKVPNHE